MVTTVLYEKDFQWPYQAQERANQEAVRTEETAEPHIWEIYDKNGKLFMTIYSRSCMRIGDKEVALKAFEHLLATHDKYYDYSDDHRVWSKGHGEATTIQFFRKILIERGFEDEVKELWKKYMA